MSKLSHGRGLQVFLAGCLGAITSLHTHESLAKARPPEPPWPEVNLIFSESFDQPYGFSTNLVVDPSIWAESWSGWCLERSGAVVAPWVVPMAASSTNLNIDPDAGALRFWYRPGYDSGSGPGHVARLLTLVSTNGNSSATWWSLVVSPDGGSIRLLCQTESGPAECLQAQVSWRAGSWHLITLGYSETNSALFVDDQEAGVGGGLAGVPTQAAPLTSLIVGSDISGREVAAGQIDELAAFTGSLRRPPILAYSFGFDVGWDLEAYWAALAPVADLGPITPEEEAAQREKAAALRAEREAALAAADGSLDSVGGPNSPLSYDPADGFWLLSPQVQGTNVVLTLTNCDTSISYDIYFAPLMATNASWTITATGAPHQLSFSLPMRYSQGFYRGAVGGDWDGDGTLNAQDPQPLNRAVSNLVITIDYPANGANLY